MRPLRSALCAAVALLVVTPSAFAANAAFQDYFFSVCPSASGTLSVRCAETPGGTGNLSGDSESSLNPNQVLSNNLSPISVAQTRSKEARERGEKWRDETLADDTEVGVKVDAGPWSLLFNIHGTWFDRKVKDPTGPERGFKGDSSAAEFGVDYRLSDRTVLGAIAGIERTSYDFDAEAPGVNFNPAPHAGYSDIDNVYATLFASWRIGSRGFVELSGGYESGDGTYRRTSVFQESTRTLPQVDTRVSGQADGSVTWLGANAGFDVDRGALSFGPYVGLTQTSSSINGFTERDESGSGLAMRYASTDRDSLLGHVGVRASYAFSTGVGVVLPQLRVEYQHEFDDDPQNALARFVLDPTDNAFAMTGGEPDRDSVNTGLSLAVVMANGWMAFFDCSVLLGNDGLDRTRATLGLRKEL